MNYKHYRVLILETGVDLPRRSTAMATKAREASRFGS